MVLLVKNITTYKELKPLYDGYKKSRDKEKFLRGHESDFSWGSPLRHHSYRLRGGYARQLDTLYAAFPSEQVLLLRNEQLRTDPAETVGMVCRFLGLEDVEHDQGYGTVFSGQYQRWSAGSWRWKLLCWWWRRELAEQARYGLHWQ